MIIEAFFLVAGIVFVILWGYELYASRKLKTAYEEAGAIITEYVSAFEEVKATINANANTLRALRDIVEGHEKALVVIDAIEEMQNTALQINPQLKRDLESNVISALPVGSFDGE